MRVVVTGATGLIGSMLMGRLREAGTDVVGLSRSSSSSDLIPTDYSLASLSEILEEDDVIVHLAAVRRRADDYQRFVDNVILTETLLKAAVQARAAKIVYMSSIAVYSDKDLLPWRESQAANPQTFYGLSKLVGEQLCRLYSGKVLAYTVLRCGIVYGIARESCMMDTLTRSVAEHEMLTVSGRSVALHDFIYVKDVVKALEWAIHGTGQANQTYNLGGGTPVTNLEFAIQANKTFGNEGNLVYWEDVQEGISESFMSSDKLALAGFVPEFDLRHALADIASEWSLG